jgi:hypothetical protein
MKKKRAQNKKNISPKKTRRKTRKNNRTQPKNNIKRNKALKDQEEIKEMQTLKKENLLTSIKIDTNQPVEKENIVNYYSKPIVNAFETYSSGLLEIFLKEESKKENLNRINEEILSNFGLTKELRKFAFKYLAEILQQYQIHKKYYFKTVLVFDSFLINYSSINKHDKKICLSFFLSKNGKEFSQTKLIIFILCCFYIINQVYNSKNFELKCLVNWNNKDEMNYEELNDLIYDILEVVDCELNIVGIYDFINIFIFDLNKRIKIISENDIFTNCFNKYSIYLGEKIVQNISLVNILPSSQALGVIMFSIEYSKYITEKYVHNEKISFLVENWLKSLKNILINYNYEDVKSVIHWLNDYINNH